MCSVNNCICVGNVYAGRRLTSKLPLSWSWTKLSAQMYCVSFPLYLIRGEGRGISYLSPPPCQRPYLPINTCWSLISSMRLVSLAVWRLTKFNERSHFLNDTDLNGVVTVWKPVFFGDNRDTLSLNALSTEVGELMSSDSNMVIMVDNVKLRLLWTWRNLQAHSNPFVLFFRVFPPNNPIQKRGSNVNKIHATK